MNDIVKNEAHLEVHLFEGLFATFMALKENLPSVFSDVEIDLADVDIDQSSKIVLNYKYEVVYITASEKSSTQILVNLVQGSMREYHTTLDLTSHKPLIGWRAEFPNCRAVMALAIANLNQAEADAQKHASNVPAGRTLIDQLADTPEGLSHVDTMS